MKFQQFVILFLGSAVGTAVAEDEQASIKFLGLKDDGAAETELPVAPSSDVLAPFTWSVPEKDPKAFDFYVTPFRRQGEGDCTDLDLSLIERPELKPEEKRLTVALDRPILTLRLRVPDLPTAGKYEGLLVALHNGKVLRGAALTLTRAEPERPVKLVIDRPAVRITEPMWPAWLVSRPSFSIPVCNDSDAWEGDGVFLRIKEGSGPNSETPVDYIG